MPERRARQATICAAFDEGKEDAQRVARADKIHAWQWAISPEKKKYCLFCSWNLCRLRVEKRDRIASFSRARLVVVCNRKLEHAVFSDTHKPTYGQRERESERDVVRIFIHEMCAICNRIDVCVHIVHTYSLNMSSPGSYWLKWFSAERRFENVSASQLLLNVLTHRRLAVENMRATTYVLW